MFKYAQIDNDNICFAVSYLSEEVIADDMIRLSEEDEPLGKKYNNGTWEELPPRPQSEPEPTQLDRIEANTRNLMSSNSALDVLLGVSE